MKPTSDAEEKGWLDSTAPGFVVSPVPSTYVVKETKRERGAKRGRWFIGQMRKAAKEINQQVQIGKND